MQRFPLTFKNVQHLNKNVYFTNFFDWIGGIRECGLYPIRKKLIDLLESGAWGMATNHVMLKISEPLRANDLVEVRLWIRGVPSEQASVMDLMFDWFKVLPGGAFRKVASSEQRVSWIKIIGRGQGIRDVFPKAIQEFVDLAKPRKLLTAPSKPRSEERGVELPLVEGISRGQLPLEELDKKAPPFMAGIKFY